MTIPGYPRRDCAMNGLLSIISTFRHMLPAAPKVNVAVASDLGLSWEEVSFENSDGCKKLFLFFPLGDF